MVDEIKSLVVFQGKGIRRIWHNEEWWFSVTDIVAVLTEQEDHLKARKYWNKLSQRLKEEGSEVVTNCHRLKLSAEDGKLRETDCANIKSLFRIIQSIPSPNAEPFKQWLAQVGYERIQEIENPELAQKRMKALYKEKGYSDARNTATTVFLHINEVVSSFIVIGLKRELEELLFGMN